MQVGERLQTVPTEIRRKVVEGALRDGLLECRGIIQPILVEVDVGDVREGAARGEGVQFVRVVRGRCQRGFNGHIQPFVELLPPWIAFQWRRRRTDFLSEVVCEGVV